MKRFSATDGTGKMAQNQSPPLAQTSRPGPIEMTARDRPVPAASPAPTASPAPEISLTQAGSIVLSLSASRPASPGLAAAVPGLAPALPAMLLLALILLAPACSLQRAQKAFLGITVIPVSASDSSRATAGRTVVPSISLDVLTVTITGIGPGGASFHTSIPVTEGGPVSAGNVEVDAGTWAVSAEGYNGESEKVAEGSAAVDRKSVV